MTASTDNSALVSEASTGSEIGSLHHNGWVRSAVFSPDGRRVLTASDDMTARIWILADPQQPPLIFKHNSSVKRAAFRRDGERIVTASADGVRVWDAKRTDAPLLSFGFEQGQEVLDAEYSPDGTRIVTASSDHTARIWDAATGNPIGELKHDDQVSSASFSPDGSRIVTASWDRTARVWDAQTHKELIQFQGHVGLVYSAAFSPGDGDRVVTASNDRTAWVWDANTGEGLLQLKGHGDALRSAVFSPTAHGFLTASQDGTAMEWDFLVAR